MTMSSRPLRIVLLLADESAEWFVAGLSQFDRALLALNDFARSRPADPPLLVQIRWSHETLEQGHGFSALPLPYLKINPALAVTEADLLLSTRMFLTGSTIGDLAQRWERQRHAPPSLWDGGWQENLAVGLVPYLATKGAISECEREFFAGRGKPQDGLVSRFLNRPISGRVSRWLARTPLTPNVWTGLITLLAVSGAACLVKGEYWSFVAGAACYHLYSILDGCDGEIARAKYLASDFGRRFDSACDLGATLLLLLALGLGSARAAESGALASIYLWEGVCATVLISIYEALLRARPSPPSDPSAISQALYERHRSLVSESGLLGLGTGFAWWAVQLTKRDVVLFAFLLLALAGIPQWMLHLHLGFGVVSSVLAGKSLVRLRQRDRAIPTSLL